MRWFSIRSYSSPARATSPVALPGFTTKKKSSCGTTSFLDGGKLSDAVSHRRERSSYPQRAALGGTPCGVATLGGALATCSALREKLAGIRSRLLQQE